MLDSQLDAVARPPSIMMTEGDGGHVSRETGKHAPFWLRILYTGASIRGLFGIVEAYHSQAEPAILRTLEHSPPNTAGLGHWHAPLSVRGGREGSARLVE